MHLSKFLRTVLKLDAASCLGIAAITLPASESLEPLLGIDASLLEGAAASLVPIGLFILWLGTRRQSPAALVWLVIVGNIAWAAASLAIAARMPGATPLGQLLVTGQGLAVMALAIAEWVGLRASLPMSTRTA